MQTMSQAKRQNKALQKTENAVLLLNYKENNMKRYIITVATELDGHAGSEAFYVEMKNEFPKKEMLNILFREAKKR